LPTTLTADDRDDDFLATGSDRVAWTGTDGTYQQVFSWKAGDPAPTMLTADPHDHRYLDVSGDRVAWMGGFGSDYQIYTWSTGDSAPTTLTADDLGHGKPDVSGDRIVWVGSDGANYQVFTWKAGDPVATMLTSDPHDHGVAPTVSGDRIAWTGSDGAHAQVCTWRVGDSAPTTLTADPHDHMWPVVSGDRVAWTGNDSSQYQVFTAAEAEPHTLSYVAGPGGSIEGSTTQIVPDGSGGTTVTAVAALGHRFVEWSDHVTSASRRDTGVSANATYSATFIVVTSAGKPTVSPSKPTHNKTATFTDKMSPSDAWTIGTTKLSLWRWETKTVTKKVNGRNKKVKVSYWHLRKTLAMPKAGSGLLSVKYKLPYSGKWRAQVAFAGSPGYTACTSVAITFACR
jgi:hypothetical protein